MLKDSYVSFINLDHRKDRLVKMEVSLAKAGIEAVRTRGRPWTEFSARDPRLQVMLKRTPGAIGCYFTQMDVMRKAYSLGKNAFVMEDDLIFCDDFLARMERITEFSQTHLWDIFWMGGTFHVNPPYWHKERDAKRTNDPRFMRTFGAFSTHAYIVKHSSILMILEALEKWMTKSMGIDWSFIQMEPHIYTYAFVPGCIIQYDNKSDIGSGNTIFSGFSKLGPYWFAKKMEDFNPEKYDWHEAT